MPDISKADGDDQANTQLVTPALSPISEHGDSLEGELSLLSGEKTSTPRPAIAHRRESLDPALEIPHVVNGSATVSERRRGSTTSPRTGRLSQSQLQDLVSSPDSLPVRAIDATPDRSSSFDKDGNPAQTGWELDGSAVDENDYPLTLDPVRLPLAPVSNLPSVSATPGAATSAPERPSKAPRSASSSMPSRKHSASNQTKAKPPPPSRLDTSQSANIAASPKPLPSDARDASPMPSLIPLPPVSLPTYLQLELSADRPSPLYIHRSAASDFPYESSKAKFERLHNFLMLPPHLEQVLWFGAVSCLDAWLYTFTILPLRFLKALAILIRWWTRNATKEIHDLSTFVYRGTGRLRERQRQASAASSRRPSTATDVAASRRPSTANMAEPDASGNRPALPSHPEKSYRKSQSGFSHRRTRSTPSGLSPNHKADILQGLLIAASCSMLMWLDASRMYHNIRGQAAIKLYVIYNVLEVFDRLFSALGQDVLECLFSKETLERDEYGRSKIWRPLWMFMLALVYNVIHSTALFYQVVTLNVAVNSYSNALLTLLMSNQFVEIKGTVFKKFDKENLFQLTCADIVERFQLWLMLLIIALRNIVEVGGLSISLNSALSGTSAPAGGINTTSTPLTYGLLVPQAFTLFPKWTGEVVGPFLIVLGSEALVDWCKHAYITKFNQVKPNIYGRFLDVLAKDYYSHAFADQNLTKRLGLPVIPLSCLFIRACVQTYHMFLATYMPLPIASTTTGISLEDGPSASNPATTAALQHIDHVFRRALGRSSFGSAMPDASGGAFSRWTVDDAIAFAAMALFFLALYLLLLALKLVLGMALLSYARRRYRGMKGRESRSADALDGGAAGGRRVGAWGSVEVGDDKRRWIYDDDPDGLRDLREREERGRRRAQMPDKLDGVQRYSMAAKRIW